MDGTKSGEEIFKLLESILDEYNITEKIFKIVTDNGRNIVKAIRLTSQHLNKHIGESDEDDYENEEEFSEEFTAVKTEFLKMIDNIYGRKHVRCFIHTNQLVVKDGLCI